MIGSQVAGSSLAGSYAVRLAARKVAYRFEDYRFTGRSRREEIGVVVRECQPSGHAAFSPFSGSWLAANDRKSWGLGWLATYCLAHVAEF